MPKPKLVELSYNNEAKATPSTTRYLIVYVIGIFSVAVLLMILSYLSQSRAQTQNELMINQHNEFSKTAFQNLEKLQEENAQIRDALMSEQAENNALLEKIDEYSLLIEKMTDENKQLRMALDAATAQTDEMKQMLNEKTKEEKENEETEKKDDDSKVSEQNAG